MKAKQIVEYRYYNIPENEYVLPLLGDDWRGIYGNDNEFINKMLEKLNKTGRMLAKNDEDLNLRSLILILFEECRNRKITPTRLSRIS